MGADQDGRAFFPDVLQVLRPETGVARSSDISFDEAFQLWTVRADVGLGERRGYTELSHVGACGFGRGETMVRAAGEAVERFALMAPAADERLIGAVPAADARRVALGVATVARSSAAADSVPADCIPAVDGCQPGELVLLPCAAVNDPIQLDQGGDFDATPSGAASGATWRDAMLAALLESVERDAVQTAWALRPRLARLDHPAALRVLAAADRDCRTLAEVVATQGLELTFALIPTDVLGMTAVIALLFDETGHGMVAAGCAVSPDPLAALRRAGRESLQVLAALRSLWAHQVFTLADAGLAASSVTDDLSRARFWSAPSGVGAARDWLSTLHRVELLPPAPSGSALVTLDALLNELGQRGLRPLVCDLTYRLPAAARCHGWRAARAVVLGHQVLRMNERHGFTWCTPRLIQLASLWECNAEPSDLPHPFI
jgi:ribosomal protein S12 methylthiotransferase accessory factor